MAQLGSTISIEAMEAFLSARTETGAVPGLSVSVVKSDRMVWAKGFGFADLATSSPATPQTNYLWFSMTKIVTATAVLRLAESGKLDLDAPADEYFRGLKVVSQPVPVTVRQLLNHSSGLANPLPIRWVRPADAPDPDRSAFVRRLLAKHRRLKSVPGERASYSNLGYLVLGEVISEVTGASYEEYVCGEILSPRDGPHRLHLPRAARRRRCRHGLPAPVATFHSALQGSVAEGRGWSPAGKVRRVQSFLCQGTGLWRDSRGCR
jgi:CubicO group peptidase (beta-lactamase class C family)